MKNLQQLLYLQTGVECHFFEIIPSTNAKVWDLIDYGANLPLVAIACQQTHGKGQRGHQWQSNHGGLYLSLGLKVNLPANCANHLILSSVWGIVNNFRKHQIPAQIKWLNDILLEGKKLGGILTETRIKNNEIKNIVIGVGINYQNQVPEKGINLESILKYQINPQINSLEDLALITTQGILNGYQYYLQEGLENLIISYEKICFNLGQKILIQGQEGIITGINKKGELKVKLTSTGASTEVCFPMGSINLGYGN